MVEIFNSWTFAEELNTLRGSVYQIIGVNIINYLFTLSGIYYFNANTNKVIC